MATAFSAGWSNVLGTGRVAQRFTGQATTTARPTTSSTDTVQCKAGGPVEVNGKALDEPYIFPGNSACDDKPFGPFTVPEGKIWVMGDHRQESADSRYHIDEATKGFVPVKDVVGRAVVVAWPVNRWATLPVPKTFDQPGINAATGPAPGALGVAGALPLVFWRRRRLTGGRTAG